MQHATNRKKLHAVHNGGVPRLIEDDKTLLHRSPRVGEAVFLRVQVAQHGERTGCIRRVSRPGLFPGFRRREIFRLGIPPVALRLQQRSGYSMNQSPILRPFHANRPNSPQRLPGAGRFALLNAGGSQGVKWVQQQEVALVMTFSKAVTDRTASLSPSASLPLRYIIAARLFKTSPAQI